MKVKILFLLIALSIRGFAQQDSVFIENGKFLLIFYNDEEFKSNDTTPGLRACLVNERDKFGCYRKIADTMYHDNGSIFRVTTFIDGDNLKTVEYFHMNFKYQQDKLVGDYQSFTYQVGCLSIIFNYASNKVRGLWITNKNTMQAYKVLLNIDDLTKIDGTQYTLKDPNIYICFDKHLEKVDIKIHKSFLLKQCTNMTITQPMLKYLQ